MCLCLLPLLGALGFYGDLLPMRIHNRSSFGSPSSVRALASSLSRGGLYGLEPFLEQHFPSLVHLVLIDGSRALQLALLLTFCDIILVVLSP